MEKLMVEKSQPKFIFQNQIIRLYLQMWIYRASMQ